MKYKIKITKNAQKSIEKMDPQYRIILLKWMKTNLEDTEYPYAKGKALKSNLRRYWRYQCGQYRIIVEIQDKELIILVVEIGNRNDIYETLNIKKNYYMNERAK